MSPGRRGPVAVRLYRRALVVLPRPFRQARGEAMVAMLADEWREHGRAGLRRLGAVPHLGPDQRSRRERAA